MIKGMLMKKRVLSFVLCVIMLIVNLLNVELLEVSGATESFETTPKIANASERTIALKSDGTVWAWGKNDKGQLGDGTYTDSKYKPVQVLGLNNIVDIDVSDDQNIALKSDGTLWIWGYTYWITGKSYYVNTPVKMEGIEDVIDVALGMSNVAAIKSDGSVWTWGENDAGQLGNGDNSVYERYTPCKVEGISDAISVTASELRVSALKSDGTVWIWGGGSNSGILGGGRTASYIPIKVEGVNDIKEIKAVGGYGDVYMLHQQGTVWKLSDPYFTNDENGKRVLVTQPEQIEGLYNIELISDGVTADILVIDSNGDVWAYGQNGIGESIKVQGVQECIFADANSVIKKDGSIWIVNIDEETSYRKFGDFSLGKIALTGIRLNGLGMGQESDLCVVELGHSIKISLVCEPLDASIDKTKVQWSTSDPTIATVENGIVTGIKEGYVTVTAIIDGKQASCIVAVIPKVGYKNCSYCSGAGNARCWNCNATGKKVCNKCGGDGKTFTTTTCTKCNGYGKTTGYVECPICHGTKISFSLSLQAYVSCIGCNGIGKVLHSSSCQTCTGTGNLLSEPRCTSCNGSGTLVCASCDKGYRECYSCSGDGKIKRNIYMVSYDANGGTNPPYDQVKIESIRMQISDTRPVREGYVFCGWAIDSAANAAGYMPGDYITEDKSIKLYAVWEEEKILTAISIAQMPYKVSYIEGEMFDSSGLVVTAHYSNGTTQAISDYEILGYETTPGEKRITITYDGKVVEFTVIVKTKIPQTISSSVYKVSETEICKISIGTSIKEMLDSIEEKQYVKVFKKQTEVKSDEIVGTGMTAKIMDGNTVAKSYNIIVTGDVNGDGNATVTDMLAIKAHLLGKNKLSGEYATAADTSGDNAISITDFIQVKAKILGKGNITAR